MTATYSSQDVYGLLSGYAWTIGNLTYSFPTAASNYGSSLWHRRALLRISRI